MQNYNLYEFGGYELLEELQKSEDYVLDFSSRVAKGVSEVVRSVETHNDNAMFFQVRKCIQQLENTQENSDFSDLIESAADWNENSLKDVLIYIDFSAVFPFEKYAKKKFQWTKRTEEELKKRQTEECRHIVKKLFDNGFGILHEGIKGKVCYVPFEKSASMARTSAMLFIDERLYRMMERRIRLGFNFHHYRLSASKLYAYTGLYLSDAKRIEENDGFVLNEETVIVLPDNVPKDKKNEGRKTAVPLEVFSASEDEAADQDGLQQWEFRLYAADEYKTSINYFDGEGIVSMQYCAEINKVLNNTYGMSGTAASIQIRMPFTKGMLHSVDFHKLICEELNIDSCDEIYIIDVYGRRRNLAKAQIILTQSMFKIDKWLSNHVISGIKEGEDPLSLYFDRFHEFDHAFYVGITDMNLSQSGRTKLNYQFLNTLALTNEEFAQIAQEQADYASRGNEKEILSHLNEKWVNEEVDTSFDSNENLGDTWSSVAARNPAFLGDPKVRGMLKGVRYSLLKDLGCGRLTVSGSAKFLSRDLLAFISFMIGRIETGDHINSESIKKARDRIWNDRIRPTRFFTADCIPKNPVFSKEERRLKLKSGEYYGILRSPHLSRSEQCSLQPFIPTVNDIYTKYFGHLKGILMVSMASFSPQALGGADFDGDMVKLFTDKRVNCAINEACYFPDNEKKAKKHERRIPIVMIPETTPRIACLSEGYVDFQTIQDTFSSRVGELSNRAIYFGREEYDRGNPNFRYYCEICTILVGLEIDAAKTGRHPSLEDILGVGEKDYFIAKKEEIEKLPARYVFAVEEIAETENTKGNIYPHRLAAVAQYGPKSGEELLSATYTDEYDGMSLLDWLPLRFLQELSISPDTGSNENEAAGIRFSFEKEKDWKKQITDPEKVGVVKNLISSYKQIMKTSGKIYRVRERLKKSNYVGCINTILKIQNKGLPAETQLPEMQQRIFGEILDHLGSYESADKAMRKLVKAGRWQFCESDQEKEQYIKDILNLSDKTLDKEMISMLGNFRWNGYYLLYYFIKDVILYHYERTSDVQIAMGETEDTAALQDLGYYDEFRQIFEHALSERESKKIWKKRIIERCRAELKEVFEDRADIALMYVHSQRRYDPYGTFFWDVFTANEILQKTEGFSNAE